MTPTEQEIEFFTKHQAFFERLWEPRIGDWALCWDGDEERWGDEAWLVLSWYCEGAIDVMLPDGVGGPVLLSDALWLPRQDQLWKMIKAQGLKPGIVETSDEKGNPTGVYAFATHPTDGDIFWEAEGPTPAIALGRTLIEVMNSE